MRNHWLHNMHLRVKVEDWKGEFKGTKMLIIPPKKVCFPADRQKRSELELVFQRDLAPWGSSSINNNIRTAAKPGLFHTDLRLSPSQQFMFKSRWGKVKHRRTRPPSLDAVLLLHSSSPFCQALITWNNMRSADSLPSSALWIQMGLLSLLLSFSYFLSLSRTSSSVLFFVSILCDTRKSSVWREPCYCQDRCSPEWQSLFICSDRSWRA